VTAAVDLTFECKVNAGSFQACSSPTTFTFAGRGTQTITIRATDEAGNVEVYPESVTVQTKGPPV
jgi:hypothetical protein